MKKQILLKYGVSKGRDTYGYNIVTMYVDGTKVTQTCGGGYDMRGTVLGKYATEQYKELLKSLTANYGSMDTTKGFYGLNFYSKEHERHNTYHEGDNVYIDGACGWSSVERILNEIGVTIEWLRDLGTKNTDAILLTESVPVRLDYLRGEILNERISYGEIAELQSLIEYIAPDDVLLLEWAGVPESSN